MRLTALFARAELPGNATMFGGIAAHEVLKIGGKYVPIHQWFHIDWFELAAEQVRAPAAPAPVSLWWCTCAFVTNRPNFGRRARLKTRSCTKLHMIPRYPRPLEPLCASGKQMKMYLCAAKDLKYKALSLSLSLSLSLFVRAQSFDMFPKCVSLCVCVFLCHAAIH